MHAKITKLNPNQKISFVLPIYNEEENVHRLWEELQKLKNNINLKYPQQKFLYEFVFVSDGSKDNSENLLREINQNHYEEAKVVIFGRNFGHQIAVTAGQDNATGDAIIIMDTDLQDPPEVCLDLIEKWLEGYDIVYAQRKTYKVPITKKIPAFLFYRLMAKIAHVEIPKDTGDFRLISKAVNDEMKKFPEKSRFLRGISFLTGFSEIGVQFDRADRHAGKPVYTLAKSMKLAIDGITSFSLFPIRLVTMVGLSFSVLSMIFGVLYITYALFTKQNVSGWPSLMFAIIFTGGVQMLMLGIIGEYIGRIYTQVLDRPLYTVVRKFGFENENNNSKNEKNAENTTSTNIDIGN